MVSAIERFHYSLIEAYNIVERRVKFNKKTPFYRKIYIIFADKIGLINY